jgi:membrane protein YdbS with pleckstrin-like domain
MTSAIFEPSPRLRTKFFVMLAAVGLLALGGTFLFVWLIAADAGAESPQAIALLAALVGNALWILPMGLLNVPYCQSLLYEIREDEAIVRVGVITRSVKHVPFRTVTNLEVTRGPFDRLFGLGTLKIQTAGMSGQKGAEEELLGLSNVDAVYGLVAAALRRYRGAMAGDAAGEVGSELGPGGGMARAGSAGVMAGPLLELDPLPPHEITVTVDYGELRPVLEMILRELRVIRQNIEL